VFTLYKQFSRAKMHKFRSWCNVPYEDEAEFRASRVYSNQPPSSPEDDGYEESSETFNIPTSFFKEDFEIDMEYENYEQIEVPSFRGGRRGRFIHDFSTNKTGIIDLDGRRCFVMPLNRSQVLTPHSLFDLVLKMKAGYYEVDTEVVRETMRVVRPPITDYRTVGYYITRECSGYPTYNLQRISSPVVKRSLQNKKFLYTEFAGKKIVQINIINWSEPEDSYLLEAKK